MVAVTSSGCSSSSSEVSSPTSPSSKGLLLANSSTHSLGSTRSIDCSPTKDDDKLYVAIPLIRKSLSDCRCVRFNECLNEYFDHTGETNASMWYSSLEYDAFRKESKDYARRKASESETAQAFQKAYESIQSIDYLAIDEEFESENAHNADLLIQECLQNIHEAAQREQRDQASDPSTILSSLTGVETRLGEDMTVDALRRRFSLYQVVPEIQSEVDLWARDEWEEEMVDSCINYSQTAILYARLIASVRDQSC